MRRVARWGPLLAALLALAVALARAVALALAKTDGHLTYVLDDPYIHMAIARNLASHGVWGVTPYEFTSASSSPLWTLALAAGFKLLGAREWLPFALDAVAAAAVLAVLHEELVRRGVSAAARLLWLIAVLAMTPLPALVFCGLEHVPQLLVMLMFAFALAREIELEGEAHGPGLPLLAAAMTALRYEGLFAVAMAAVLLVATGRVRRAVTVGIAAAIPPLAFGLYSLSHGGALLPNSILLKGNVPQAGSPAAWREALGGRALAELKANLHLLVLALALVVAWLVHRLRGPGPLRGADALPSLVLGTLLLHLQLAQTGWFFRYEAYLVGVGLAVLAWMGPSLRASLEARRVPWPGAWMLMLAVGCALASRPLVHRAVASYRRIPTASMNIHQQQYQMGRFVGASYAGQAIALDDIGAVTFLADVHCLDLVGLANLEVLRLRDGGHYDSGAIAALARREGTRAAIVYEKWFETFIPGGVPPGWTRVGLWRFPDVIATYSDSVSFYAVRPDEVAPLAAKLRAFAPRLPAAVEQRGPYTTLAR